MSPHLRSQIILLSGDEIEQGQCAVCGRESLLQFTDASAGARLGRCCISAALCAEAALNDTPNVRPPTRAEVKVLPNH